MLSDYEDMIFKQLYCQLSNSDSDLHLLLEEIRKEDDRTPSYLRNVKELEDKSLLHMVVYGDEHEEIFNEGLTDYRWLVEEVTYKIGYSGRQCLLPYLTHINNKIVSVFSVNTPKAETISLQKIESPYCILQKSTVVFRFSASSLIFLILAITISLY